MRPPCVGATLRQTSSMSIPDHHRTPHDVSVALCRAPVGPPGVGKTHLAIGLAIAAAESGRRVYYGTLGELIESLEEAHVAGHLAHRLKRHSTLPAHWGRDGVSRRVQFSPVKVCKSIPLLSSSQKCCSRVMAPFPVCLFQTQLALAARACGLAATAVEWGRHKTWRTEDGGLVKASSSNRLWWFRNKSPGWIAWLLLCFVRLSDGHVSSVIDASGRDWMTAIALTVSAVRPESWAARVRTAYHTDFRQAAVFHPSMHEPRSPEICGVVPVENGLLTSAIGEQQ